MYFANYDEDEIEKDKCMLMDFVSAPAVLVEALGLEIGKIKRSEAADINSILNKFADWERALDAQKPTETSADMLELLTTC